MRFFLKITALFIVVTLTVLAFTNTGNTELEKEASCYRCKDMNCNKTWNFLFFSIYDCRYKVVWYSAREVDGVLVQDSSMKEFHKTFIGYFGKYKYIGPY